MALQPILTGGPVRIAQDPGVMVFTRPLTATLTAGVIVQTNTSRSALSIYNASVSATLYVLVAAGGTPSSTFCTVPLGPGDYWELPNGMSGVYKGQILGVWSAAVGQAVITEYA